MNVTDSINKIFYRLIRISIGIDTDFPFVLSSQEWNSIYSIAKDQTLLGVCFAGIEWLYNNKPEVLVNLPKELKMQWYAIATNIRHRNRIVNGQCVALQRELYTEGLRSCILKGQGVACYYSKNICQLRQPGDIDIWVDGTWQQVMTLVAKRTPNKEFDLKHAHYNVFKDTPVEVHWVPSTTSNFILDRKLKHFYRQQSVVQFNHKVTLDENDKITAADPFFDSIHLLLHILGHYLYEGVGLRQVMDYYYIVRHADVQQRKEEIIAYYKDFGLYGFSKSVMWVLNEVFHLEDEYLLTEPDEERGRCLLDEIMKEGNMGHASVGISLHNETTLHRWCRRWKRKLRLIRYNALGVVCNPIYKARLLWWKQRVIKLYNL